MRLNAIRLEPVIVTLSQRSYRTVAWQPKAREYLNGVVFDPSGKQAPGVLNLWEGFTLADLDPSRIAH